MCYDCMEGSFATADGLSCEFPKNNFVDEFGNPIDDYIYEDEVLDSVEAVCPANSFLNADGVCEPYTSSESVVVSPPLTQCGPFEYPDLDGTCLPAIICPEG